jgi:hypothetical protein
MLRSRCTRIAPRHRVTVDNPVQSPAQGRGSSASGDLSARVEEQSWEEVRRLILFALEPSDHAEPPPLRTPISDRVDRLLVIVRAPQQNVSFITPAMVDKWQYSLAEVEATASRNLVAALAAAKLEYEDVDGVRLGFLGTELPIKAALIHVARLGTIGNSGCLRSRAAADRR